MKARLAAAVVLAALAGCGGGGGSSSGGGGTGGGGTIPNPGTPRTLTGRVTYDFVPATATAALDFAHAAPRPARAVQVKVLQGANLATATVLATATASDTGDYSLTYTPAASGALAVVAYARTASPPIEVQDNTDAGSLWGYGEVLTGSEATRNLHAGHGWAGSGYDASARDAAPFAILDSMLTASRAFLAVRPVAFPALVVNWSPANRPQSGAGGTAAGLIGTSHYNPGSNQIFILGAAGADTDEFDTHVIVHEWAHFFEANLSRSDSPGGPHGSGDVLDPRLAFGEGYGNALAAMVLPETVYVDTMWGGGPTPVLGVGVTFDAESPAAVDASGGFSERNVMALLYDIFDPGSAEPFDGVAVGLGVIHDVLTGPQRTTPALTTIASFVTGLRAQPGLSPAALDALLAHYNVGPVTGAFGTGDPALAAMYAPIAGLPFHAAFSFGTVTGNPNQDFNKWEENQYFTLTGNGARITVTAVGQQDVDFVVYRSGTPVASGTTTSATETASFTSLPGATYVIAVTGYGAGPSNAVTLDVTSP